MSFFYLYISVNRGSVTRVIVIFVVAVSVCGVLFVIIIRCRLRKRRDTNNYNPIQLNEVTSTTEATVRFTERSPRRRRSTSLDSVTLYSVNEHKDWTIYIIEKCWAIITYYIGNTRHGFEKLKTLKVKNNKVLLMNSVSNNYVTECFLFKYVQK